MARNDISFQTVGIPQLNLNASATNSGINAVQEGIKAFQNIGRKYESTLETNKEIKADKDLSNLKRLADETLGGPVAGESLQDYDRTVNEFLAENGALTGSLGDKALNAFRDDFEKDLTQQRNQQEGRATTLETKRRADQAYDRSEAQFAESEVLRKAAKNAKLYKNGKLQEYTKLRDTIATQGAPATMEQLAAMDLTTQVRQMEADILAAEPNIDNNQLQSILNNFIASADRVHLNSAQRTKLARDKQLEQRAYDEQMKTLDFDRQIGKEVFQKALAEEPAYGVGDVGAAKLDYIDAVTKANGEQGPPSDDVLLQYDELASNLIQEIDPATRQPKWHAADIGKALAAATKAADSVFTIRFDEDIDRERVATYLQAAKASRLHNKKQQLYGVAMGRQTVTDSPAAGAPAATGAAVDPDVPVLQEQPAAAANQTDAQVANLQADAAVVNPTPTPVPSPGDQAAQAKEAELVPPLEAKSPKELKAVAINQLTNAEAPKVEANLEAALKKVPRGAVATSADDILRGELIEKLANLREYINALETPQSKAETRAAAAERAAATQNLF